MSNELELTIRVRVDGTPLVPERPASDLQVKYDALDKNWCYLDGKYSTLRKDYDDLEDKHREAQERITELEKASTPRTAATESEYEALPAGSVVHTPNGFPWTKDDDGEWKSVPAVMPRSNVEMPKHNIPRSVLRYGWGDEQPAWRIEAHNPDNFRVGEYIIDIDGDSGTVTPEWIELWDTDEDTFGARRFAPFIVFPSRDAATPEAVEEAKRARDKEMEE